MKCQDCGGTVFIKSGTTMNKKGTFQLYKCKKCARIMTGEKVREAIA